jgi:3-octaprenyl-4-hydroxybenzoate carboxy-lyase
VPIAPPRDCGINAAKEIWLAQAPGAPVREFDRRQFLRSISKMGFLDQRQWMASLEQQGELRRITAEVDWDREVGAISRRMLEKKGPALLFENIKGYASGRCTKLFVSGLGARSRLALALGFPREASNRELVQ